MVQLGSRKRWLNAVLIAVLILVWGFVVRMIVLDYSGGDYVSSQSEGLKVQVTDPVDTLGLKLDYPDPFAWVYQAERKPAGKSSRTASAARATLQQARKQYTTNQSGVRTQVQVKWPAISYHGILRRTSSTRVMAMFTINGNAVTCPEGMERDGVKILKTYVDSALVEFAGEKRIVKLSDR